MRTLTFPDLSQKRIRRKPKLPLCIVQPPWSKGYTAKIAQKMDATRTILGGVPSSRNHFPDETCSLYRSASSNDKKYNNTILSHLKVVAGFAAEAAAVRVVGAAEEALGDGVFSRAVVAVHRVPDDQATSKDIAVKIIPSHNHEGGRCGESKA